MATTTVAAGKLGTPLLTLTSATVEIVNFSDGAQTIEIASPSSNTADIWYTIDGSTPTVGGDNCLYLPPGGVATHSDQTGSLAATVADTVKMISSGTPSVRVQKGI